MLNSESVYIRVTERDGDRHDLDIDLTGVKEAVDFVTELCPIDE